MSEDVEGGAGGDEAEFTTAEEVLVYLIERLVDGPADLEVDPSDSKISFTAKVSSEDIGRVIGKRGRVANSIRTLVRAAAVKDGVEVEVEFSDQVELDD